MPKLINQCIHPLLKESQQEWWEAGPVSVAMTISNYPEFRHFDEEECWVANISYLNSGKSLSNEDDNYFQLTSLCDRSQIPYAIADNGVGQNNFYIPSRFKMTFLDALENCAK